jgi:hypothetical protein
MVGADGESVPIWSPGRRFGLLRCAARAAGLLAVGVAAESKPSARGTGLGSAAREHLFFIQWRVREKERDRAERDRESCTREPDLGSIQRNNLPYPVYLNPLPIALF